MKTVLIGFGDIAEKHLSVLNKLDCNVIGIVAKNYEKAVEKSKKFNIPNVYKSIENIPIDECDFLMNLTSTDMISSTLKKLIPFKKPIFTEKPIGFGTNEIAEIINQNKKFNSPVMVGMNRRFYSIFHKAFNFLKEHDKSIESIKIDAPERFSSINQEKFNENSRKNWMFVNSIHCVDLIRFFGGDLKKIEVNSLVKEKKFNAFGSCENGIDFSYSSDWQKLSRWNISLFADGIKIIFEPIENGKIFIQNKQIEIIPSEEDLKFKPGFYGQMSHFLNNFVLKEKKKWPASDLVDHKKSLNLIEKIFLTKTKSLS